MLNTYMKEIIEESYTQQKQITQTAVLSDVGGNMGMFLVRPSALVEVPPGAYFWLIRQGMSVITMGEILIFFVKWFWGSVNGRRRADLTARGIGES